MNRAHRLLLTVLAWIGVDFRPRSYRPPARAVNLSRPRTVGGKRGRAGDKLARMAAEGRLTLRGGRR